MPSEFVRGLKCRLCGKEYPLEALNFCIEDFGPLEVDYNYDAIGEVLSRGEDSGVVREGEVDRLLQRDGCSGGSRLGPGVMP